MNKYKIENPTEKYCEGCGKKKRISPENYYDEKTGRQNAKLICRNTDCGVGRWDMEIEREHNCPKHEYTGGILGLFLDFGSCRHCGKPRPYEVDGL